MLCVEPDVFSGAFKAPPSKPISQRLLLAGALAEGETIVKGVELSDDVVAMLRAIQPLARISIYSGDVHVERREPDFYRAFNVMESGFTLRTAVAVYAGVPGLTAVYYGGTLRGRPIDELIQALKSLTDVVKVPGAIFIRGKRLSRFEVEVRADISSQFISGLMFLAAAGEGGVVRPVGGRKSWSFVEATTSVLKQFGARVEVGDVIEVDGGLRSPGNVAVPGDYSLAAFLIAAGLITGGRVEVEGQASDVDKQVLDIFADMGAHVAYDGRRATAWGTPSRGVDVDLGSNPDLVMPVALVAAFVEDWTAIRGVEHLRYKESDRVASVLDVLQRLGVEATYKDGALHIRGPPKRRNVQFLSHGDHRIGLMALAASKAVGGCLDDVSPISKSWPTAPLYFIALPEK